MDKITEDTANKIFDLYVNKCKDRKVTVISILDEYATEVSQEAAEKAWRECDAINPDFDNFEDYWLNQQEGER